jgi:Tol biopolymer transport system component
MDEAPLWRVPIVGGTPRRIGNLTGHDVGISPDGKKLAYTTGADIYVADADGGNPCKLLPTNSNLNVWAWRPAWSPDGKRLRFDYYQMWEHESKTWEVNPDGSNPHQLLSFSPDRPMYCNSDWTADGKYFVFSSWKDLTSGIPWPASNLWALRERTDIFHQSSSTPVALTTGPTHFFSHTLSPDGKTIFASSVIKHGELMRYITRTKVLEPFLSGLSAEGVAFSADQQWIAYVKYPQGELWRSKANGSEPLQLTFRPLFVLDPSWSPDGKQLAFTGQRAGEKWQLYTVSMDGGTTKAIPTTDSALGPSWSPDGNSLVFVNAGKPAGDINLLDLRTGKISDLSDSHDLFFPQWSPDGRYIAAIVQWPRFHGSRS